MIHAIALVVCLTGADADSGRWPAFLGAGAAEVNPASLPVEWSPDKLSWKATVKGYGQSSPVIWDGQVIITSVEGANKEKLHIASFDLKTGKERWDLVTKTNLQQKNSVYISRAAPTPLVDENGIYAYFESGDVFAVSHEGKPIWKKSLTAEYGAPENRFGVSASPVQWKDRIIILIDDASASYVVALDKKNGDILWKTDRRSRTSWSSPGLVKVGDKAHIVCSSDGSVDGYDPETGKQLWTYTEVGGNTATSPIDLGGGRFLVAASPGRRGENATLAKKSNGLMKIEQEGDEFKASYAWVNDQATPSWASPIAHQGYAYWINRAGVLFCIDMESGKTAYNERIGQSAWATPIAAGERIYVFRKDGSAAVIDAGPKFKVLAENRLWTDEKPPVNNLPPADKSSPERERASAMFSQPVLYGAAVVDGVIVMRSGSQLFCVKK